MKPIATEPQEHGDPTRAARILVVEDEFLIRFMLAENLREQGFEVVEACNADEALTIICVKQPNLIVTDVSMPGSMDGIELLNKVRGLNQFLPVILVSGHLQCFPGVDSSTHFMPKPYAFDNLLETVQSKLKSHK